MIWAILLLALTGCGKTPFFNRFAPAAEQAQAIRVAEAIRDNRQAAVAAETAPWLRTQVMIATAEWQRQPRVIGPTAISAIHVRWRSGEVVRQFVVHSGGKSGRWAVFALTFHHQGDAPPRLVGFAMRMTRDNPARLSGFDPLANGVGGILWLALVAGTLALSIAVAVWCWRQRAMPWRRVWAIASLFGVVRVSMDWASGDILVAPFALRLPVIDIADRGWDQGWRIGLFLPIVALVVLVRQLRTPPDPELAEES